jgi:hypothetical protein
MADQTPEIAITARLYAAYGTDTGILFGIPADLRGSVETIVKIAIEESAAPEQQARIENLEADLLGSHKAHKLTVAALCGIVLECGEDETIITRLEAEKAELLEATQRLVEQFEKWEGYHQWDEQDETALERTRAALAKHTPSPK